MKIIFIHGMNQQEFNAAELKQRWLNILGQGISAAQMNDPLQHRLDELDIDMAFYGDLLKIHQLSNVLELNSMLPQSWLHLHSPINFDAQHQAHQPPIKPIPQLSSYLPEQQCSISKRLASYAYLLQDHVLKDLIMLINRFPHLHGQLIHKFLIETYLYLANPQFVDEVHQRVLSYFDPSQQHIVVAHSLGSVIAYNLLQQNPQFNIQRLITLGSPLSFRVIQEKIIQPIVRPNAITGDWYNFYSQEDFLSSFPLSQPPFAFEPAIINHAIHTFIRHPHEIAGYLQHPAVIQQILSKPKKRCVFDQN